MMRLFLNGLAASAGGGLTYLRNVIPELARRNDVEVIVLLSQTLRREFPQFSNTTFVEFSDSRSVFRRVLREQTSIAKLIHESSAEVLLCAGNFALWNSPVPQILLSRNALYTSTDFMRDIRSRGDHVIWADTLLKSYVAKQSILRADVTVAPSHAFAKELTEWSGKAVVAIHHGFNSQAFCRDPTPLPAEMQLLLDEGRDALRLLFVSHYNYYRNFETLFRAIPALKRKLGGKKIKLYLTCRLNSTENPGSYRAGKSSGMAAELGVLSEVIELGSVPYRSLHRLYQACHIYVTPAYAESFAHPLVEAMSSGLPIVASDLPVHREICGDAAIYFPRFSPEDVANRIVDVHENPALAAQLSAAARVRSQDFSWTKHATDLLILAEGLLRNRAAVKAHG